MRKRVLLLTLSLAIVLSLPACISTPDGDSASAGRVRIGRGRTAKTASRDKRDIDEFSPEGSMERDLAALRRHEEVQEKKVADLRGNLNKGSDLVRREEEKLAEIRQRIGSYDTAIERYEMASRSRPPREEAGEPSMVPEEMFEDGMAEARPVRHGVDDYAPDNPFSAPAGREGRSVRPVSDLSFPDAIPVREYRSSPLPAIQTVAAEVVEPEPVVKTQVITAPGTVLPKAGSKPRAEQMTASRPSRAPGGGNGADGWQAPGMLFARTAKASIPEYPTVATAEDDALDKAVREKAAAAAQPPELRAMAAPAQVKREAPLPKTTFRRLEAATPAPAKQMPTEADMSGDEGFAEDEVFTPDLFLSGG